MDGVWRFTFIAGYAVFPNDGDNLNVFLKVDGSIVASSFHNAPNDGATSYSTMTINSLQRVTVGQTVTIEFFNGGDVYLQDSSGRKSTHWTGVYMGLSTPAIPECQYVGQVFEFPGSCRDYYYCGPDGTVSKNSCCPDVFVAEAQACLPEDLVVVEEICPSEDAC